MSVTLRAPFASYVRKDSNSVSLAHVSIRILYQIAIFSALPTNALPANRPLDSTLTANYAKSNTLPARDSILLMIQYARSADSGLSFKEEPALEPSTVTLLRLHAQLVPLDFS